MNLILPILSLLLSHSSFGQAKNPFLSLKFDKVIIYDFEGGKDLGMYVLDEHGQFSKTIRKQVQLDKSTINTLNARLGDKKSYGRGTAACFDPHLGIVYFFRNKAVANISICLECNRLASTVEIKAQEQGKIGTGYDAYYIADGLSKSFRLFINGLLKKYSFSHQLE